MTSDHRSGPRGKGVLLLAGRLRREDRGAALATVALLGTALVVLTAVIVMRGVTQHSTIDVDRDWEQALHVAESGLDEAFFEIEDAPDLDTFFTVPATANVSDKDAIVALADTLPASSHPEGEYVIVKPEGSPLVFGVGYTPSRDDPNRKIRVVKAEYEPEILMLPGWSPSHAFASGGDLDISNNVAVIDPSGGDEADVHANGVLDKKPGSTVEGCASGYGNSYSEGECPPLIEPVPMPPVNPRELYRLSMFDLCPNGMIRSGPAHPTTPNPNPDPCTGPPAALPGWSSSVSQGIREWTGVDSSPSAVVYVHHGDVTIKLGSEATPKPMTILVTSHDETGGCGGPKSSGHLRMNSGSNIRPHPTAMDLSIAVQGDVKMNGGSTVEGLTMAHEQIHFSGGTGVNGAVIAESACDGPNSPVGPGSVLTGGTTINYSGGLASPFNTATATGDIVILDEAEMSRGEL